MQKTRAMGKSQRQRTGKACQGCGVHEPILFRIKFIEKDWGLYCKRCQEQAKSHDNYQYGGTWKQNKRN